MDLESTQNNTLAKLPLLKQENGNSFTPVPRVTTHADGTSTSTIPGAVTAEEKIKKRNDVKARSILMMALPNEHQLTFNQHKDAKTLFEAIEARFGGNEATKKTQMALLKQSYENFNASSSESLDSIFNRLQNIVSQLSILGVNTSQEDLNLKFLRSFPAEWNTHVVVWRNKSDLESMSIDDLYNNFKIVEQEVKRSASSSSNSGSKNMAFVSTPGSTNEDTANIQVCTASTPVSTVSTNDTAACLSDATVYAFLANQPSGSQIVHEDLEQLHDDDLEEMDLKWQLALLRHFARECRNPRSQDNRARSYDQGSRSQDTTRRTVRVEDTSSKAMMAMDGTGFDWSHMAEEEAPTNMALMAFSDSEVYNNKTCSNTCLKSYETLKTQYDNLRIELNKSEFDLANYKRGLASVEEQLVFYKQNEVIFTDQIAILKRDASFNESEIIALKIQIEKLKKDKEDNLIKIDSYDNASKSLGKLIGEQLTNNNKKGVGYNAVPPPPTRNKSDLESISIDNLYNNFKIVEQEVKRSVSSSSNSGSQNMAFVSTPSSTNEDTANIQVCITNTLVSTASTNDSVACLSDAIVYAFLANQPSGSQIVHEDLEQLHDDDLEEMDLKWQLALLSIRAKKFYQRIGKKITINGGDTTGFDKTKVECFNCHKLGHFARECRNPRSQESRPRSYDQGIRSQDTTRRTMRVEDTSSKAMVAIDGAGFDWSYMTEEEAPTNMALMAFSDSKVYNNKSCSNTCLKSYETLKTQYDNLRIELNKSEFDLANYKRGLASVEEQLDASFNESEIIALKIQIEKLKKDKEDNLIKIDSYDNASKSLDKLIGEQLKDNNRKGVGYNVVPLPPIGLFAPPTIDLSNSGLEEFRQPEFEGYGLKPNKTVCVDATKEVEKILMPQ
ncbi:putative ribonuclease H-like domain-containing protein [Tanacetum coccineum]